jgi:hypothetical protein
VHNVSSSYCWTTPCHNRLLPAVVGRRVHVLDTTAAHSHTCMACELGGCTALQLCSKVSQQSAAGVSARGMSSMPTGAALLGGANLAGGTHWEPFVAPQKWVHAWWGMQHQSLLVSSKVVGASSGAEGDSGPGGPVAVSRRQVPQQSAQLRRAGDAAWGQPWRVVGSQCAVSMGRWVGTATQLM